MPTNTEIYHNWIAALKSGNYPKGLGYLNHEGKYCCLGVACALYAGDAGVDVHRDPADITAYDDQLTTLPRPMMDFLGLRTPLGTFTFTELSQELQSKLLANVSEEFVTSLATINDHTDDFNIIIEILEERPPSLFA